MSLARKRRKMQRWWRYARRIDARGAANGIIATDGMCRAWNALALAEAARREAARGSATATDGPYQRSNPMPGNEWQRADGETLREEDSQVARDLGTSIRDAPQDELVSTENAVPPKDSEDEPTKE